MWTCTTMLMRFFPPKWTLVCKRATCSVGRVVLHLNFTSGIAVFSNLFTLRSRSTSRGWATFLVNDGVSFYKKLLSERTMQVISLQSGKLLQKNTLPRQIIFTVHYSLYFFKKKKKSQLKNVHLQMVGPPCHRKYRAKVVAPYLN